MSGTEPKPSHENSPPDPFDNDSPDYWAKLDAENEANFLAGLERRRAARRDQVPGDIRRDSKLDRIQARREILQREGDGVAAALELDDEGDDES